MPPVPRCSPQRHRRRPGPAVALRLELAAARQSGETFEDAWAAAMATALEISVPKERESWETALWLTKGAWEAAYNREDALAGHGGARPQSRDMAKPCRVHAFSAIGTRRGSRPSHSSHSGGAASPLHS